MASKEVDLGPVRGDINDSVATFTQASARANINSGETGKTIFGKIKKFFADIGAAAFCQVVNNFTTTAANTVADGRALKTLKDQLDEQNRNFQLTDISSSFKFQNGASGSIFAYKRGALVYLAGDINLPTTYTTDAAFLFAIVDTAYCPNKHHFFDAHRGTSSLTGDSCRGNIQPNGYIQAFCKSGTSGGYRFSTVYVPK